jgi:O-antigen chain-terminating methyltransferase
MYDLGCSTCEWVELLNGNGYPAIGVDNNSKVVEKVKTDYPAINIIEADACLFLEQLLENSVDFISTLHVAEHFETYRLMEFIKQCRRVLKPGGMLIIETPNPQNILTSTYYFNLDPTHKKPIPPELLEFFISESGMRKLERVLLYPLNYCPCECRDDDPLRHIIYRFNMEQSYAVIAVK